MRLIRMVAMTAMAWVLLTSATASAWAEGRRLLDAGGFSVSQNGSGSATGTIRTSTTISGSSSSGSPSRVGTAAPSRSGGPAGSGASASGSAASTEQSWYIDPVTGRRVNVLTNFIPYGSGAAAAAVPAVTVPPVVLARQAAATLDLPMQAVRIGPAPSLNRWDMLAVGYPLWLWREGGDTITESVSLGGATLTMTAGYRSTTYDMGDGTTVTCTTTTPWVAGAQPPGTPSPTCGHTYRRPGDYTVTATHTWDLNWSAMGETGTFPLTNVSSAPVEVGELASLVVGR